MHDINTDLVIHDKWCKQFLDLTQIRNEGTPVSQKVDLDLIRKAVVFCKKYHGLQTRDTGEPYYSHPIAVAEIVSRYRFNNHAIITSLLHDLIEDTEVTANMIEQYFGSIVAQSVEFLTRIKINKKLTIKELINQLCSQNNDDLLLIKFCDRLHNMQTIYIKNTAKQQEEAIETIKFFLPIISYLGIFTLEQELLNLCKSIIIQAPRHENKFAFEE